jgi:hypothetical protein
MKEAATFIKDTFESNDKIICVIEGPTNSKFVTSEVSISWDTAEGMCKTLTDPEVCDTNEDLFYFTIGKLSLLDGESI